MKAQGKGSFMHRRRSQSSSLDAKIGGEGTILDSETNSMTAVYMILRVEMSLNFPGKKTDWKAKSVWMGTRSGTRMDMDTGAGAGVHRHKNRTMSVPRCVCGGRLGKYKLNYLL